MKIAGIIFSLLILTGCAVQPAYKPLPESGKDKIGSADTIVGVAQKEITPLINPSQMTGIMGGGLLWALVDSAVNNSRAKSAEATIEPIKNVLLDYDFNQKLIAAVQDEAEKTKWLSKDNVVLVTEVNDNNFDKLLAGSQKDAVLFVTTDYKLSADFQTLIVTANVNLFPKTDELRVLQGALYKDTTRINDPQALKTSVLNSIYRNMLVYRKSVGAGINPAAATARWTNNNGAAIHQALDEGVATVAAMLTEDLKRTVTLTPDTAGAYKPTQGTFDIEVAGKTMRAHRTAMGALEINR